jgi:2-oxo-3-hexenedioate decarboxylase
MSGIAVNVLAEPDGAGRRVAVTALEPDMLHPLDAPLAADELDGPAEVSAGLVLVVAADLEGPDVTSGDVLASTSGVIGALQVSAPGARGGLARLVLGPAVVSPDGLDLGLIGVLLESGGVQVATAAGAATLGHPATAAAEGINALGPRRGLDAGSLVYTGRLTPLFPLARGSHARAAFGHLGSVGVRLV